MRKHLALPEICRNSTILGIILFTQFSVCVIWLLGDVNSSASLFGVMSLYALWAVLLPCLCLCWLKPKIEKLPFLVGSFFLIVLVLALLLLIELVIGAILDTSFNYTRLLRVAAAATIITLGSIWVFGFLDVLKQRSNAESESRVLALQSRIQPHFLFNSLNTISELTVVQPKEAEKAISSLSTLFRASLENKRKHHSLESEINLCERYLELEHWRLDKRLKVNWSVAVKDIAAWQAPKLILQPLIENSIVHGVQDDGSIDVAIDIRESKHHLSLKIENSLGEQKHIHTGHGIAVDNIRERLQVLYDDQHSFRIKQTSTVYSVIMRFPKQRRSQVNLMEPA